MDYTQFQKIEDMTEVTHIFKKIFDGKKSYGTDEVRMGFFKEQALVAKVEDNKIFFSMPFYGALSLLQEILEKAHYNKTNSILVHCERSEDNTMLTATFYSKEFKLFTDF